MLYTGKISHTKDSSTVQGLQGACVGHLTCRFAYGAARNDGAYRSKKRYPNSTVNEY